MGVQVNAGGHESSHGLNHERRSGCQWEHPPSCVLSERGVSVTINITPCDIRHDMVQSARLMAPSWCNLLLYCLFLFQYYYRLLDYEVLSHHLFVLSQHMPIYGNHSFVYKPVCFILYISLNITWVAPLNTINFRSTS